MDFSYIGFIFYSFVPLLYKNKTLITFQTDESSDNDEKMSDANAALAESSEVLVGDALPESHQVAASCSKFYGSGRAIKNVIRKRSTVTTKKFLPKKGKRFSKPAVVKKLSKSTATSRADGDPNWQIIDGIYENPNSNLPLLNMLVSVGKL